MKANASKKWIFLGLFLAFFLYFYQSIDTIPFTYWDEPSYVNAARSYLESTKPYSNSEHPPLGKELIALSISLLGDGPQGWRMAGVFCGSLTLSLICFLVFRWTRNLGIALFLAILLPLDPMLLVNFRIGLLEAPLMAGLIAATTGAYLFLKAKDPSLRTLYFWGVAAGLALSVKFNTLAFFPLWWGLALLSLWKRSSPARYWIHAGLALMVVPVLVLFLSYAVLGYTPGEVAELLTFMFGFHRVHKGPSMLISPWHEWFWIRDPIWYFIQAQGADKIQGILLSGNLVLWIGALLSLFYLLIRKFRQVEFWLFALPVLFQIILYARKPSTYLYYMVQILPYLYLMLGGALGDLWKRWGKPYGTLLKVDFGLFWVGALIVFLNYWPFIWGKPFPRASYLNKTGQVLSNPVTDSSSVTPGLPTESQESPQGQPDGQ